MRKLFADYAFSFENKHVGCFVQACFCYVRNIARFTYIVSQCYMEMIIHAFILSVINFCTLLFLCLSKESLTMVRTMGLKRANHNLHINT